MGVCVEPMQDAMALWSPFEQFTYRSAAEREGRDNARSTAGDLDLTIYRRPFGTGASDLGESKLPGRPHETAGASVDDSCQRRGR